MQDHATKEHAEQQHHDTCQVRDARVVSAGNRNQQTESGRRQVEQGENKEKLEEVIHARIQAHHVVTDGAEQQWRHEPQRENIEHDLPT